MSREFDPTWNYLPRTQLIYALPLALAAVCLERGWVGPDFWVAFLWGLIVPAVNIRRKNTRSWAFKDFMDRDACPPTIAVLHGAVWACCLGLAPAPLWAAAAFALFFLAYDALLLHYRLLVIYALPLEIQRRGALGVLAAFGPFWWGYLAAGLWLTRLWGVETPLQVGAAALCLILPAQLALEWERRRAAPEYVRRVRTVAVVGAGWAGLYATRWLKESGLQVTCFEAADSPGGVWRFREEAGGVARSTRATSSKHFLHASDFPMPAEVPDFPEHAQVLDYLEQYARRFGLGPHLETGRRVRKVVRRGRRWIVGFETPSGERLQRAFDALCVCAGPHRKPRHDPASHPLYRNFAGEVLEAGRYKCSSGLARGETVLIVGAGESAADIAAECARHGARVYWASRRGQWFADRNIGPYAADHFTATGLRALLGRFGNLEHLIRRFVIAPFIHLAWGRGGHGIPAWHPRAPYLHQFLNKSREGVLEVYRGRVQPRRAPVRIEGRRVWFQGCDEPADVSRIILATGYEPGWEFLRNAPRTLYKLVFAVDDPTLAFVGYVRPVLGSIPSLAELQARWVAGVFSGRFPLPGRARRRVEDWVDRRLQRRRMLDSSPGGVLVDQEVYATATAARVGAQVRWLRLLARPRALLATLASPWTAFKYRLHDPDPDVRRQAVRHIEAEMPDGGHPVFLLNRGLAAVTVAGIASVGASLVLLPLWVVAGAAAALAALAGLLVRGAGILPVIPDIEPPPRSSRVAPTAETSPVG